MTQTQLRPTGTLTKADESDLVTALASYRGSVRDCGPVPGSLRARSLTQKIKVCVDREGDQCGSRAGEALAGVAGSAREQQSPERACARERGRAWFCAAKRPGEAGVAPGRSPRSGDMRSMRAAQRRSWAGAQAPLEGGQVQQRLCLLRAIGSAFGVRLTGKTPPTRSATPASGSAGRTSGSSRAGSGPRPAARRGRRVPIRRSP